VLIEDFDPLRLAGAYRQAGAAAVSVLTDTRYFQGHLEHLRAISAAQPGLPLLRKDFICDPYQVYEARAAGASAVLLIAAHLDAGLLRSLHQLILEAGMAPLVEVHNREEFEKTLSLNPRLVGVNNRDLHDFTVRIGLTLELRPLAPAGICFVAESGIHTPQDVMRLAEAHVNAMLVGEALVTAPNVGEKVRRLYSAVQNEAI
jgi:indole-3-glycerol phosphate synthase